MKSILVLKFGIIFTIFSCQQSNVAQLKQSIKNETSNPKSQSTKSDITCTDSDCKGTYIGAEFIDGSDVAHQFSNNMSEQVGNKLKELYKNKNYKKVDFEKIVMSTKGMGSGNVEYFLFIPFVAVENKCDAYTSFDHCGGWNHSPAIEARKLQLSKALIQGEELNISTLKTTPEGLQEYWIQWRNKELQGMCK